MSDRLTALSPDAIALLQEVVEDQHKQITALQAERDRTLKANLAYSRERTKILRAFNKYECAEGHDMIDPFFDKSLTEMIEIVIREWETAKARAGSLAAENERLRQNQRTPGTVEVCPMCQWRDENPYGLKWEHCCNAACPIKSALTNAREG